MWPEGSKIFLLSSLLSGFGQQVSNVRVESECNNASVVFTGWIVATPLVPWHPTHLYCTEQYTANCTVHFTVHCTLHCTVLYSTLYQSFKVAEMTHLLKIIFLPASCIMYLTLNFTLYWTLSCILSCTLHCTPKYTLYLKLYYTQTPRWLAEVAKLLRYTFLPSLSMNILSYTALCCIIYSTLYCIH